MSRTNNVESATSPVQAYISFNGQEGVFGARVDSQEEMLSVKMPFTFVVIDNDAHSVGGKTTLAEDAPRYKSNLAHAAYSRTLRVILSTDKDKVLAEGTWGSIKSNPALSKAKYTQQIFVITDLGNGKQLARISLHGKALAAWMNATKEVNPCGDIAFRVTGVKLIESTKGPASYVPVFETVQVSKETLDLAAQVDTEQLQPWFREYFKSPKADNDGTPDKDDDADVYVAAPQPAPQTTQPLSSPQVLPPMNSPSTTEADSSKDDLPF